MPATAEFSEFDVAHYTSNDQCNSLMPESSLSSVSLAKRNNFGLCFSRLSYNSCRTHITVIMIIIMIIIIMMTLYVTSVDG